jgi:hypothetical protein
LRLRILVGSIALVLGLAAYGLIVMAIAVHWLPSQAVIEIVYYTIAGIAWVWPAARLTGWMQLAAPYRPPQAD